MSNNGGFSEEQSEDLISHLKSDGASEFEQLRSALNLLAHVTELPPTSIPPVLPSQITQPAPVIPIKSHKSRRTIVTSVMVVGLFASASLAAAAVTGIGPTAIVNVGHQAAKFVKGVVGGVAHIVTGGPTDVIQNQASGPRPPLAVPTVAQTISSGNEGSQQSDSEHSALVIPPLSNLFPPVSTESDSNGQDLQKTNPSHENQGTNTEDTPIVIIGGNVEQNSGEEQGQPSSRPTAKRAPESSDEETTKPTPAPKADQPTPSPEPTSDQPTPSPEPTSDQPTPSPEPTSDQPTPDD